MSDFNQLIGGFRAFKATRYLEQKDIVGHLIRQGLKPKTLFITCCDMRSSPDILFSSNPGDFLVLSNPGALISAYSEHGTKGIVATLEHAISDLKVDNIIILGHAKCDSIEMLMNEDSDHHIPQSIKNWLSIVEEARDAVNRDLSDKEFEEKCDACEHEAILVSLKHLLTYPFVEKAVASGDLNIYGWHFDIQTGILLGFNPESKFFEPIG